jgi:hypothetical protein
LDSENAEAIPKNLLALPLFFKKMSENEYKKLVLEDFDQKILAQQLPAELISPTPGGLKSESVKICERRFDSKDEILLSSFFNKREDAYAYRQAIYNGNADVFKPLTNFLKDRSINTALKNIDLLAWLIDFRPRPYNPSLIITSKIQDKIPNSLLGQIATDGANSEAATIQSAPSSKKPLARRKMVLIAGVLLMVIALTSYFVIDRSSPNVITGHEGCMFWQDNHYQPIDCSKKFLRPQLHPINYKLVNKFRKITLPDTLTMRSVGKVWYAKFRGRIEFYTQGGAHPVDTNKRLLPMSDHILKKYIYHLTN